MSPEREERIIIFNKDRGLGLQALDYKENAKTCTQSPDAFDTLV